MRRMRLGCWFVLVVLLATLPATRHALAQDARRPQEAGVVVYGTGSMGNRVQIMAQGPAISYTLQLVVAVPANLTVEPDMSCQADLAGRVGMSARTVSSWVNGQRVPDPASCDWIVDGLGVDVDEVPTRAGHRPRIVAEEPEKVRRLVAPMRGMAADVLRQVEEFVEWHRERERRIEEGVR